MFTASFTSISFATLCLLLFTCTIHGQSTSDQAERIDSLVRSHSDTGTFHGAVLVARGETVLYKGAVGQSNREWETANSPTTKFQVGSVTKPVTAVVVFQAIEDGQLSLNGKVTDYLPDFPGVYGSQVTIGHLLSHTSGIIDFPDVEGFEWNLERLGHSEEMMLDYFQDVPLLFEPGSEFRYSNFGNYLLTVILEKVYQMDYANILQERILNVADMPSTSTAGFRKIVPERAEGYANTGSEIINAPPWDQSIVKGSGDMVSTVVDLHHFIQALYSGKLLTKEYRNIMLEPTLPEKDNYAFGWFVSLEDRHPGENWVRHSGSINGFSSIVMYHPDEELTIVILANLHGVNTTAFASEIYELLDQSR